MPGVVVTTQTQIGPSAALRAQSGQFFIVGLTERGSVTDPILVRGMADVESLLGSRVSYGAVWDQLKTFFDEGGLQAYVSRVVGPAAAVGTLELVDREEDTPLPTLQVNAANPGAWSSRLKIQVQNGSIENTFRIIVTLDDVVVEDKTNLASPVEAVAAFSESQFIRVTDLGSTTNAPDNNPAVLPPTALSAGTDDRVSVTTSDYVAALNRFKRDLGDGAVAIPGQTDNSVWIGIEAHCRANNRIGLLSAAIDADKTTLLSRAGEIASEYCGVFAPWIKVSDGNNGTRTISPEGYVAAVRTRAHDQIGPWAIPAGRIAVANSIQDLHVRFPEADADDLDNGKVNIIRVVANTIRLYGWRSLSNDPGNYWFLKDRDLLNNLVVQAERRLEDYVFATIDTKGHLLSQINASLVGLVAPIASAGGLYARIDPMTGQEIDPGYKVETGSEVNTPTTLAGNEIRARLLVRIAPAGGLISLTIVKHGLHSGL